MKEVTDLASLEEALVETRDFILSGTPIQLNADTTVTGEKATNWYIEIDKKYGTPSIQLNDGTEIRCYLILKKDGTWFGRDRIAKGYLELIPTRNTGEWIKIAGIKDLIPEDKELPFTLDWKDYDSNYSVTGSVGIAIVGYNRPGYLNRVVQSIARNREAQFIPIYVFLDKCESTTLTQQQVNYVFQHLPNAQIFPREHNLGCGKNIIDIRRQMFDVYEFERVFLFEDDLIIAPNYIRLCLELLDWSEKTFGNVGAVQAWSVCGLSLEEKRHALSKVQATYENWWGYLMPRSTWNQIKDFIYEYEATHLKGIYSRRNHNEIVRWFHQKMKSPVTPRENKFPISKAVETAGFNYFNRPPSGQDAATMVSFALAGLTRLTTVVNRSRYIGENGIHMNKSYFKRMGYDKVMLDLFPTLEEYKFEV